MVVVTALKSYTMTVYNESNDDPFKEQFFLDCGIDKLEIILYT